MDVYENETRFYRVTLGISYEFGSRLSKIGVLTPDAQMADGRPLFSVDVEAIERHRAEIRSYRARRRAVAHNLKDLSYVREAAYELAVALKETLEKGAPATGLAISCDLGGRKPRKVRLNGFA